MKVLVTGATGFVGQHVITQLLQQGYSQIIATSRNKEKAKEYPWYPAVQYVACDLYQSNNNFFNLFQCPDLLIHLAWSGLPNYRDRFHIEKNLFADYAFLKNMISNGLHRLVVTGTCFEYGLQNGRLTEDAPCKPVTNYGLAKDTLRRFLQAFLTECPGVSMTWLRLFYMYGAGQNPGSLFGQLEKAIKNKDPIFNMTGGEQLRDYLPVEQVADYIVMLAGSQGAEGIFNVCSGKPISIRKIVEDFIAERGSSLRLNRGYYPYATHEPIAFWGDRQKLDHYRELL